VAMITMIGGFGGFFGPYLTGFLKDLTHSFTAGLMVIAGLAAVGAALCLLLGQKRGLEDA
jgi:MFS transporter, ACS family, tartrate transporter